MNNLEIDKKVVLASTLVAALIGSMCSVYNSSLFSLFSLKINTLLKLINCSLTKGLCIKTIKLNMIKLKREKRVFIILYFIFGRCSL